jgi:hypothetical protein
MAFSFLYLAVRALLGALVRSRRVWVPKTQCSNSAVRRRTRWSYRRFRFGLESWQEAHTIPFHVLPWQ